jgi:alkylation response protein AidB-like acyl-CoA dehydrogenase
MALILNEEQNMLRDSAAQFLKDHAPVSALRKLRDSQETVGFSRALWAQFSALGFASVLVPEAYGGSGLGLVEAGVLAEQIGHHLSATPFLASSVLAVTAIRHGGSPQQQQHYLPLLAAGKMLASVAVDERSKHQPTPCQTHAEAVNKDGKTFWRLNGAKMFVLDGHVADVLLVLASLRSDALGQQLGLFFVPRDATGLSIERTVMVDAHNAARVQLKDVEVPASALLGEDGSRAVQGTLQLVLNAGRACAAAELVGIADEVFARTVAYLKERKQFGRLIGEFQALQHRAAALFCDIELARAAVAKALFTLDQTPASAGLAVSIAKARAGSSATLAVQEGVQMHGGMGMTDEFDLGLFMKRARVLQEFLGDANFHQNQLALHRGY